MTGKFLAIFAINCFISASANALIIEKDDQGLHFKQHEVQPLPVYQIKKDYFVEKKEIHKVAWPHFEIEILEKKDEFSLCRVLDKNDILWIKNEFIYEKKKHYYHNIRWSLIEANCDIVVNS